MADKISYAAAHPDSALANHDGKWPEQWLEVVASSPQPEGVQIRVGGSIAEAIEAYHKPDWRSKAAPVGGYVIWLIINDVPAWKIKVPVDSDGRPLIESEHPESGDASGQEQS